MATYVLLNSLCCYNNHVAVRICEVGVQDIRYTEPLRSSKGKS